MKTILIPMNSNPFVVVINNNVYQYKAGQTMEVPDEVAEAIENALALEPKPKRYLSKFAQFTEGTVSEIHEGDLEGIQTVSAYAFYQRPNLRSVEMPEGVESIGAYSIAYCLSITEIEIPSSVTTISYRAFSGCDNLAKVTFAEDSLIQVISDNAFADCTSLARVVLKTITPPYIQANTFTNVPTTCVFEVPPEALEAYKAAENWSAFANQIVAIEE